MNQRLTFCALVSLVFISSVLFGQTQKEHFDQLVTERLEHLGSGANVLVAKDGKVIYNQAIGMADAMSGKEMMPDQVFRIGSITKQFTAAAIMQLIEKNKIDLQDPISTVLDDIPADKASITVEELLTHTSGLGNQNDIEGWQEKINVLVGQPAIRDSIFKMFLSTPLAFPSGSAYKYSNFGYFLLGAVIENVSGTSYEDYLTQHIFQPLQMHNTNYENSSHKPTVTGHSAVGVDLIQAEYLDMRIAFSGGGLLSTVQDLNIWNKAVSEGKVIGPDLRNLAHTAHKLTDGKKIPYGYGWMIGKINQEETIKHDGIINGFTSFALYVPAQDVFVVVLTNCDCTGYLEKVSAHLAAAAMNLELEIQSVDLTHDELREYSGIYQNEAGNRVHITLQDGVLKHHSKGGDKTSLVSVGSSRLLFEDDALSSLAFSGNQAGEIISFQLHDFGLGDSYTRVNDDKLVLSAITLSEEELDRLAGQYEFPIGFTLEIVAEENRLYGHVQGDRKELSASAPNKFYAIDDDIQLEFNEQDGGMVMTLRQAHEMEARKKN